MPEAGEHKRGGGSLAVLSLGALGVVFGDIGTSPLYAIHECFAGEHRVEPTTGNVLGVLSLVVWSLTLVVSIKYLLFIMRADNHGEGGIFALLALVPGASDSHPKRGVRVAVLAALFGAALLYGDGAITPAISVMSAVEGLAVNRPHLHPILVPITCAILIVLFLVQRRGVGGIGRVFGPVMCLWFLAIGVLGLRALLGHLEVVRALNPVHAVRFFVHHHLHGFVILGAVVLCITGGEALYADMGQFGRAPIRLGWFVLVMPALLLNYLGQGAILLEDPEHARHHPFFSLVPESLHVPAVILAALATAIASQALISGAFSLTSQAIQMRFMPRMHVIHTSREQEGQLFIPQVNWLLMAACLSLVLGFRTSDRLAGAYGIAVTGTMGITTVIFYLVATRRWGWPQWQALPLCAVFLAVDVCFFGANVIKITEGGWFPLLMAAIIFAVMTTWRDGTTRLRESRAVHQEPLPEFLARVEETKTPRVPGAAVFFTTGAGVPKTLSLQLDHNHVLHEKIIFVYLEPTQDPAMEEGARVVVKELAPGLYKVVVRFGFMEQPSLASVLCRPLAPGLVLELKSTTFFILQETVVVPGRFRWRTRLFELLDRNAPSPAAYLRLPPERVIEMGARAEL